MQLAIYAHPFDLDALATGGGLSRLRDLGIGEVALACSYHDGRWLMAHDPRHVVRFLEDGTVHFRPRSDYGALQPQPSSFVPANGPDPLDRCLADAARTGLRVRAWTVFAHNTRLGERHAESSVQNAFGDRYSYALCPAQPSVQQYELAVVRDLAARPGLHTLEFEALGQMGWKHSSHHDKASFTPSGLLDAALSACFCSACSARLAGLGHDPQQLAAAVREFVRQQVEAGDAMAPVKLPGNANELAASGLAAPWLEPVLAGRAATIRQLAAAVTALTPQLARAVQVHPHPWFTGSQLSAASAAAFPVGDERVLTCYGEGPDAIGKLLDSDGAKAIAGSPRRVCLWPKAPQFNTDEDLRKLHDLCTQRGIGSLAIYHLGLLPWRTIERVAKMFAR